MRNLLICLGISLLTSNSFSSTNEDLNSKATKAMQLLSRSKDGIFKKIELSKQFRKIVQNEINASEKNETSNKSTGDYSMNLHFWGTAFKQMDIETLSSDVCDERIGNLYSYLKTSFDSKGLRKNEQIIFDYFKALCK